MKSNPSYPCWSQFLRRRSLACQRKGPAPSPRPAPPPSKNDLFNLSLCVEGQVASVGSNSLMDIIDQIDESQLQACSRATRRACPRARSDWTCAGSVTLGYDRDSHHPGFHGPEPGINESFSGGTRDISNDLFEDYIKQNGDDILRELLRVSAVDPLAGNPASVQSQMAAGDFAAGVDPVYDTLKPGSSFGLGARFGSYSTGQFTRNVFTCPSLTPNVLKLRQSSSSDSRSPTWTSKVLPLTAVTRSSPTRRICFDAGR